MVTAALVPHLPHNGSGKQVNRCRACTAMFTAMRRASSRVVSLAAEKLPILLELDKGVGKAAQVPRLAFLRCVVVPACQSRISISVLPKSAWK